jgi:DNA-binding response OmpR family regulator
VPERRIAIVWERCQTRLGDRIIRLAAAIHTLSPTALDEATRWQAIAQAEQLAATLGCFGLHSIAQVASQLALRLHPESQTADALPTLGQLVESLQHRVAAVTPESLEQSAIAPLEIQPVNPVGNRLPVLLIIEADRELAELLQAEALTWGFQPEIALTPQLARQVIERVRPDCVLLELFAPDPRQDGLGLLADLAEQYPQLPILVFTQSQQWADRRQVTRFKRTRFLQKPALPDQVLAIVAQLWQQTQASEPRILVVEDNALQLTQLTTVLAPWGWQIIPVQTANDVWSALETTTPDLLILSAALTDINSLDLCQALRQDPHWNWLPVVMLTAVTNAPTLDALFQAGVDDYASLPIIPAELVTRVLNRLERSRQLRHG